jgi:broad specificity phosphatase PhoE
MRLLVALAWMLTASAALSDDKLWQGLERGGQVVLIRHAVTTPGFGDPPGMRLDDCGSQRNLTDEGRDHARRIGEAFRTRKIPLAKVLSSPWCRCIETAKLAFGRMDGIEKPLSNLFGRAENREEQVRDMRKLAAERPKGGNLVLVSHGSTISALTGINPGTGEMVILTPKEKGRFDVAGRLAVP